MIKKYTVTYDNRGISNDAEIFANGILSAIEKFTHKYGLPTNYITNVKLIE